MKNFDEPLLPVCGGFQAQQLLCMEQLKLTSESKIPNAKFLRGILQENAFNEWCNLKVRGHGVFEECTDNNEMIMNKIGLSSLEIGQIY